MADHTFYSVENRHNERQIRLLSVGSLVSKPPTKEKRISIKVQMPLSGTINMGSPTWLDEAHSYVAKTGDFVKPNIEFKGFDIDFSVENLFGSPIQANNCMMRGFEITEIGSEETPDVVLNFVLRMPFSTARWNWFGQFVGDGVWAKFTPGEPGVAHKDEDDGTLLDDGENDEDEGDDPDTIPDSGDEDEDDTVLDEPADPRLSLVASGPSGPKNLKEFHEQEVEKETKASLKKPKGFSKPLNSHEF